ncbi:unnamed protein product, partial [Rotaria magnacalcarata]
NLLKHLKRKHTPEYEKLFIDQVEDSSEVVNGSNHRSTTELSSNETNDGTSTASDIRVSIQETGPITDEVVPACLSTPNP